MALILPILLILLFGIIIAGFMFSTYIQVSNATREGARAGSVYPLTRANSGLSIDQTVRNAILSALGNLPINASSFVVTSGDVVCQVRTQASSYATLYNCADGTLDPRPGDRLFVSVTYHYTQPILAAALPMFPQPLAIVRNVMMEIQ